MRLARDTTVQLTVEGSDLVFKSPYNPRGVDALKEAVPWQERKWDGARKVWIVAPKYGKAIVDLALMHWGERIDVPQVATQIAETVEILDVHYLGMTKDRGNGESFANAWINGQWAAIFPEAVLRAWFADNPAEAQAEPEEPNLFKVLLLDITATADDIRRMYRRLARQWHPDVCKEPNATAKFQSIQRAYDVLYPDKSRKKFLAGLRLQEIARTQTQPTSASPIGRWRAKPKPEYDPTQGYRSPLRCGWIMVRGYKSIGKFNVIEILGWEDISNAQGQTLVSSWPAGAEEPLEVWS